MSTQDFRACIEEAARRNMGLWGLVAGDPRAIFFDESSKVGMVSCRAEVLLTLRASLCLIKDFRAQAISLMICGVSGTRRGIKSRIRKLNAYLREVGMVGGG